MTRDFTSSSTVFQSYQGGGRLTMKWNPDYSVPCKVYSAKFTSGRGFTRKKIKLVKKYL